MSFLKSVFFRAGIIVFIAPLFSGSELRCQTVAVAARNFAVSRPLREAQPASLLRLDEEARSSALAVASAPGLNFSGIPNGAYVYPDSNGAVGATQYMQWANARYAVFSKTTGKALLRPTAAKSLWTALGGQCASTNAGDGIVAYDKQAARWVVTHHTGGGAPYLQCVAVSTTSDATGSYYLYAFQLTQNYPDYPQLGVWSDAYYLTLNLLTTDGFSNIGAQVCALDRANMLIGNPSATVQCAQTLTNSTYSVLQPADLDGATPPPAGTPNFLLSINTNSVDLFTFHVDWVNPANTTLKLFVNLPVQPFTQACGGGYCIPQSGTSQVLDGVGDRLLHRLAYRNFGTYDVLVINHAISAGTSVGVRWYEIRNPGSTPVVYQQGTIAPDSNYRWLGSLAMDKKGDISIGYSVSSGTMFPSIRTAFRLATDPLGSMGPESTVFSGTGSQITGGNDWGNASSMSIDPVDDCTFWYTNEYLTATGQLWSTRINSYKIVACQ